MFSIGSKTNEIYILSNYYKANKFGCQPCHHMNIFEMVSTEFFMIFHII